MGCDVDREKGSVVASVESEVDEKEQVRKGVVTGQARTFVTGVR